MDIIENGMVTDNVGLNFSEPDSITVFYNWINTKIKSITHYQNLTLQDTPNRFKHYRNAAGEFTCLQPKWKESEED